VDRSLRGGGTYVTTIFRIQGVFTEPYDTGIVLRVNAERSVSVDVYLRELIESETN